MRREFAITAPDARLVWMLPALAILGVLIGIAILATQDPRVWVALPGAIVACAVLALLLRRRRVSIEAGVLTIAAGLNTRQVALADLDLAAARIVDLREHDELRPFLRVFGTRLPGLAMGHFRLRDRSPAFVLLTDRSRVLVLPAKSAAKRAAKTLLLSLQQPQGLLDELHKGGT